LLLTAIGPDLKAYGDTMLLVAFGAACFLDFRQNRTLHCSITGPLFLLGALAAAMIEAGIGQSTSPWCGASSSSESGWLS
jgi:hypothetical protein